MAVHKSREDDELSPFYQLQKSQVLHEAKAFNDTPLDSRKCCSVLTELLCLLSQGETLGKEEATTLFFGVTKLFQSQDPQLRRLVYLVIKELNKNQDDAFIVISSLEKDINGQVELFRANGLRVHSQVIDSSMLEQRARLFRQAIVNKNEHIASSALCAGIRMFQSNQDVVKRWQNETREATKSSSKMVSFHALHLLYKMASDDRRAVMRLVTSMINNPPESPLARCLLIRYAYSCIAGAGSGGGAGSDSTSASILEFIKDQIKQYKNPMVMFEAAKCLCNLPWSTEQDLTIAMNVLQEFLNSPRPIQRFAAVRALSHIVNKFNNILSPSCTVDLEHLITDGNRNIATLAITTLLQTTAEYSIERLLSSITEFMTEIADELKIVLITAIERVCSKFPKKYECLLNFLSMALREEGGYIYKNKIVDCMLLLMTQMSRAKEFGLDSLCEFIEDCEYPNLSVRILYLIGELAPSTQQPSRYIRFIFNRVLLELPCVRAAAVSCLTKCAVQEPALKTDIVTLLRRSLNDEDDEVRDRATLFVALLDNFQEVEHMKPAVVASEDDADYVEIKKPDDGDDGEQKEEEEQTTTATTTTTFVPPKDMVSMINVEPLPYTLKQFESALLVYLTDNSEKEEQEEKEKESNSEAFATAFSSSDVEKYILEEEKAKEVGGVLLSSSLSGSKAAASADHKGGKVTGPIGGRPIDIYDASAAAMMANNEEETAWKEFVSSKARDLPALGDEICRSLRAEPLTEPEAEYQVEVIKRVYRKYVVLQFLIQQQIPSQLICDVYVDIDYDDSPIINVTAPVIKANSAERGIAAAIIERGDDDGDEDEYYVLGKFDAVLKFVIKDDNEDAQYEEGYEDEYNLSEVHVRHSDYVYPAKGDDILSTRLLKEKWQALGKEHESRKKGEFSANRAFRSLQPAVNHVIQCCALTPVEESNRVDDDHNALQHALNLIGYTDKHEAICMRAAFILADDPDNKATKRSVSYKVAVRCKNQKLRQECLLSFA